MSEDAKVTAISPLLQAQLIVESKKFNDAMDDNRLRRAFRCLRQLILMCPPIVKNGLITELNSLSRELAAANRRPGVDEVTRRRIRWRATQNVLEMRLIPLYNKVMDELYDKNMLAYFRGKDFGKIDNELLQKLMTE